MLIMGLVTGHGSPPRLWGKHSAQFLIADPFRFTPTLVGKTKLAKFTAMLTAVHPHACGENVSFGTVAAAANGSPPRLWGKLSLHRRILSAIRFTPTLVGKTALWRAWRGRRSVHPHACGENWRYARQHGWR